MIDLDDEEAFLASLSGVMEKQAAAGIKVGQASDEPEPQHKGITVTRRPIIEPVPEPIPYVKPKLTKVLCVVDLETDPFLYGRKPEPFCAGFAMRHPDEGQDRYYEFWGADCVEQFFSKLTDLYCDLHLQGYEMVVYAHNGGKFDFNYFDFYRDPDQMPFFINGRLVKCMFEGVEFRDSLSIMPVALKRLQTKQWAKLEIDYAKMEPLLREQNKAEILDYLKVDCMTLLDVTAQFIERFGWQLTIAGTALPLLASYHGFTRMTPEQDKLIRPYYKGGRVQCFKTGIHTGEFVMVDANSMYPAAMKNFQHPVSARPIKLKDLADPRAAFVLFEGNNRGAVGSGEGFGFDFTRKKGTFFATIHEIKAGLETGTLDINKVKGIWGFTHWSTFADFVDHYYGERLRYKDLDDVAMVEFMKLVLNSAYGKLAMSTASYEDHFIGDNPPGTRYATVERWGERLDENGISRRYCIEGPQGWQPRYLRSDVMTWSRPKWNAGQTFINVATAASITGAARATLWRAICSAKDPLYCDTDSVICSEFHGDIGKQLGQWKVEATGQAVAIGGKKMYAFLTEQPPAEPCDPVTIEGRTFYVVKKAHKGVQLTAADIVDICNGKVIEAENMGPTFKDNGTVVFQKRRVRMTAGEIEQLDLFEAA